MIGQLIFRKLWHQNFTGNAVIPKTSNADRLKENAALFDWTLSEEQMTSINALNTGRRFNDPGHFTEEAFNYFLPIYEWKI